MTCQKPAELTFTAQFPLYFTEEPALAGKFLCENLKTFNFVSFLYFKVCCSISGVLKQPNWLKLLTILAIWAVYSDSLLESLLETHYFELFLSGFCGKDCGKGSPNRALCRRPNYKNKKKSCQKILLNSSMWFLSGFEQKTSSFSDCSSIEMLNSLASICKSAEA